MPTIYSGSNDGFVQSFLDGVSYGVRKQATAFQAKINDASSSTAIYTFYSSGRGGSYGLIRAFFEFDTKSITVAPSSASLKIHGATNGNNNIIAVRGTQSSPLSTSDLVSLYGASTALAAGDGSGAGSLAGVSGLTYSAATSGWNSGSYNTIPLNATALADMASLGTFKVCLMDYDYDYLDISWSSALSSGVHFSEKGGTSLDPYIDYVAGTAAATDNAVFFGTNF